MVKRRLGSAIALALLVLTSTRALSQDDRAPFKPSSIPVTAKTPGEFIPAGWTIEEQISGDLNGDGRTDVALKLVQAQTHPSADGPTERQRALLILLRESKDQWRRAALATKLLQCTTCGSALYGLQKAPAAIAIQKGTLIVKQDHGSRNLLEQTFRFRYEAKIDKFLLIGVDLTDRDRATGALVEESTNLLTGQKTVTKAQFDKRAQKYVTSSSSRSRVSVPPAAIENIDYENYHIDVDGNR